MENCINELTEFKLYTSHNIDIRKQFFYQMNNDMNLNTMNEERRDNNFILPQQVIESLYNLSGYGIQGKPSIETFGDKTYRIDQYQGKHSDEYTVYELIEGGSVKDEDRDGLAQHFKKGVLQLSWRMIRGVRSGSLTIYVNGVVERMTSWSSIRNLDKKRRGLKKNGDIPEDNIYGEVHNERGIGRVLIERDLVTNQIIYRGGYNESTLHHEGYGICYDNVSGVEKSFGYYEDGQLIHLIQEFVNENDLNGNENGKNDEETKEIVNSNSNSNSTTSMKMMMIEYSFNVKEKNMKSILKRHPMYIGDYLKEGELTIQRDENEENEENEGNELCVKMKMKSPYIRHGHGYVMNELSGICDHESDWLKGIESKESISPLYGGWYEDNLMRNGNGNNHEMISINVSMIDEEARKRRREEEEEARKAKEEEEKYQQWLSEEIPICPELGLMKCRGIQELTIGSNIYNGTVSSEVSFKLDDMPILCDVSIGDNTFQQVRGFILTNLPSLQSVKVGNHCFRIKYEDSSNTERQDGLFSISNCSSLSTVIIGDNSFVDFKTFSISSVDLLKSIEFGKHNFLFADCILKGILTNNHYYVIELLF